MKENKNAFEIGNSAVESEEEYLIPNEVSCSPEFPQGCIAQDDLE